MSTTLQIDKYLAARRSVCSDHMTLNTFSEDLMATSLVLLRACNDTSLYRSY